MTLNSKHPRSIQLTSSEQEELRMLVIASSSPMSFWLRAYALRGIEFRSKLPIASPTNTAGEFSLSWHPRALGAKAIAQAAQYLKFQEEKGSALLANARYTPSGNGRNLAGRTLPGRNLA